MTLMRDPLYRGAWWFGWHSQHLSVPEYAARVELAEALFGWMP
jgi:hypothetical protein